MKKLLIGAGVLTVALFGYKILNGGSLSLPSALTSLLSPSNNGPMKKNFPSRTETTPDAGVAGGAVSAASEGSAVGAPGQSTSVGTGNPTFADEDVNSRIAQAMELSKVIVANGVTPTGSAAGAAGVPSQATAKAPYIGQWTGKFTGPDAGTVSVEVDAAGFVHGQGVSTLTGIEFSLSGKVQSNGHVELVQSTAGVASTGATFTGSLTRDGRGSGTWAMTAYNVSGTWQLDAKPPE